jgi:myo-inositol 2-dehydrogenase/D-chiro-inositol 1-dehydrogenase
MTNRLKVGLIGAGRIGRLHADHLACRIEEAELIAVADPVAEAAGQCAQACGNPSVHHDYREILGDPRVEAVISCSSTDTHARMIEEAAQAGKHIFCEKPIDFDLSRIDQALSEVDRAGVKLQIGFNRRFDPDFQRVRQMVAEGKVGTPHLLRITSRDPEPPSLDYIKASGGLFLDMTIHDFDMARYLMGDEVEEVCATGGVMVSPEIGRAGDIDTAVIVLRFRNEAIGTIDNSRRAVYGYDQRIEVFGSGGMATASNRTPDTASYSNGEGVHASKPLFFFVERYTESYMAELREFVRCVFENKPTPVTGWDGRVPVVMGLAAQRSLEENRPVKLSEVG